MVKWKYTPLTEEQEAKQPVPKAKQPAKKQPTPPPAPSE